MEYDEHKLPVQYAAACNTVEVLEFLLNEYPESALELNVYDRNLLHIVVEDKENEIDMVEAKIKLLTTKYPILLRMHCELGLTPLHQYLFHNSDPKMRIISLIAIDKEIVAQGGSEAGPRLADEDDAESNNHHLSLPLHVIVKTSLPLLEPPVSETADIIRLLINIYPESISVKDARGRYPYNYAVRNHFQLWNPYFIRILLRGDPTVNPTLLYALNYAERRLAMFISFRAVSRNTKVNIWSSLRFGNKDLLKKVISFL
jgi:hypothetical protein